MQSLSSILATVMIPLCLISSRILAVSSSASLPTVAGSRLIHACCRSHIGGATAASFVASGQWYRSPRRVLRNHRRPLPFCAINLATSQQHGLVVDGDQTSQKLTPPTKQPLPPSQLRWTCDPAQFDFATTSELSDLNGMGMLGQARAESAIEFGVGMKRDGYNLYVLGPSGAGKRTVVQRYLEERASGGNGVGVDPTTPSDVCYVNNFDDVDRPKALMLPAGRGRELVGDMEELIKDIKSAVSAALQSEEHRHRVQQAEAEIFEEHEKSLSELTVEAKSKGLDLVRRGATGVALVLPTGELEHLSPEQRKELEIASEEISPKMRAILEKLPKFMKRAREKNKELNRDAAQSAIECLTTPLMDKYANLTDVVAHIEAVQADVVEHSEDLPSEADDDGDGLAAPLLFMSNKRKPSLDRYLVNLLVDHSESHGAPVVFEDHPYYHNLVGRVEHESHLGSLTTNFRLIKAGALHRANGGYLVLRARDVLLQPFSWEALKRALRSKKVQMESLGAELSLISTVSLQPEPIPLDLKVVLLGDRLLYYLLQQHDPDFCELFKVAADFNDETDRHPDTCHLYARMLATLGKAEDSRPMDPGAVALMIEHAARQAGDQEKLSTHMRGLADLVSEADYWAGSDGAETVGTEHVSRAIEHQIYRGDRIRELVQEQIRRGTLLVDVSGEQIGQVNGLSVMSLGNNVAFGRPSRITATARLGRGKVVDIEREVDLGGSIHSKGVMILTSLLASRYVRDCPLSLSASLVFEQSYGVVEGDSASVAELCALLSTLAGLPIRQNLAITGSLNQLGEAQAIGGVNEKIEGFYDVCNAVGLTGDQGVLIPRSNKINLMLRHDVVAAAAKGKFSVYAYDDVDDAITLLTGVDAGKLNGEGEYPEGTVNFLVNRRLRDLADLLVDFADKSEHGNGQERET